MFTGLVETMGEVLAVRAAEGDCTRLEMACPFDVIQSGESIAVDGVCLTALEPAAGRFAADAMPETLSHTTLGGLRAGDKVNLERALRVGDRLGGHLVVGHVDAVVVVREVLVDGADYRVWADLPEALARYVAWKGSVTLHGVSLTVSGLDERGFEVSLIPETLERTNLGLAKAGDRMNLEVDLVARYLERLIPGAEAEQDRP